MIVNGMLYFMSDIFRFLIVVNNWCLLAGIVRERTKKNQERKRIMWKEWGIFASTLYL